MREEDAPNQCSGAVGGARHCLFIWDLDRLQLFHVVPTVVNQEKETVSLYFPHGNQLILVNGGSLVYSLNL